MSDTGSFPIVAVDIGNSSIKAGLFAGSSQGSPRDPVAKFEWRPDELARIESDVSLPHPAVPWYVSSVNRPSATTLQQIIGRKWPSAEFVLLSHTDVPLTIDVAHPERVGMDRLVAAVAVARLKDVERSAIVIDAGSAITVDMISRNGTFQGGVIVPGLQMASAALCRETDQLPLVFADPSNPPPVIGKSTEGAITSGLYWGTIGGLIFLIERMSAETDPPPQLFITGGDALQLAPQITERARLVPDLVLTGIALVAGAQ